MPALEKTFLDKLVHGAYLGKRKIGRPVKYNIRTQNKQGWIELVYNPRTRAEQYVSQTMKFIHPYLFALTYKFHVEKAREAGLRVEDVYVNKFHKEPYIMFHLYAQYFHPSTLLERVRDVRFYRQPRTMFKGFKVPDWATAKEQHGWEHDAYSRQAWDNAMQDLYSEWTPMPFAGERQEPNVLQWFRREQYGCGFGSRLFYNEVPNLDNYRSWWLFGGHLLVKEGDEREQNKLLHSFTHANQDRNIDWGIDTTTAEGREAFKAEWDALSEMAPELIKKEDMVFPHEIQRHLSTEPHFRRVWQHYREHSFRIRYAQLKEANGVTQADADAFTKFIGLSGTPAFNTFIMARNGLLSHLESDEGFQATLRVMDALGLESIEFNHKTAQPIEEQFWEQFDAVFQLTEGGLREELPYFVTDPSNLAKVEALINNQAALN